MGRRQLWVIILGFVIGIFTAGLSQGAGAGECAAAKVENKAGAPCPSLNLLPMPRQMERLEGELRLEPGRRIWFGGGTADVQARTAGLAREALAAAGANWEPTPTWSDDPKALGAILHVDPAQVAQPEGYRLSIDARQIRLVAHDEAGLFYGVMTLRQLARQSGQKGALPCLRINDWPDFAHRGVMLDISRDKVPTMATIKQLVATLAEWKINQVQLYTEHTFAYRNHRDVWEKASPMTAGEIRELDAFCRERMIELVPNQNSFGHFERWLKLDRYKPLAEVLENPSCLAPLEPGSLDLLEEMYAELLPNFSSRQFNVGCDETFELGKGRSKEAVQKLGAGRVYLDFLLKINRLVRAHGCTMQFWGDIVMQHPELIPELPEGIIAMEWGYEASHPFAADGHKFAQAGVPFYVCPGTSSWVSICGRTDNALGNLRNAAESGLANGAIGYLITDWGDGGHWQYLPVSLLGFGYGAGVSWAVEANKGLDIARALDVHAFQDRAGVMGRVAYDLGNAYQKPGALFANASALYFLLALPDFKLNEVPASQMTVASLKATQVWIDQAVARLDHARMAGEEGRLSVDELRNNAAMMKLACRVGIARLENGGVAAGALPARTRKSLAREAERILKEHRRLWLARNRPGGLEDSAGILEGLIKVYRQK